VLGRTKENPTAGRSEGVFSGEGRPELLLYVVAEHAKDAVDDLTAGDLVGRRICGRRRHSSGRTARNCIEGKRRVHPNEVDKR
jgi:hypothetical protein